MGEDGRAQFYDGASARRRDVRLSFEAAGLTIAEHEVTLATWPYAQIGLQDASAGVTRFGCRTGPALARLEVRDPALAHEIMNRCPPSPAASGRKGTGRIVFWSLAAAASLVLTAVYLVPPVADRLTPLVPLSVEQRLGRAVDSQVRALFGPAACGNPRGQAALRTLSARLTAKAGLAVPVEMTVLPSRIPNAFALPGGHVYVLNGLLRRAGSVDEVAGVLAHELGHVAHRDGLRLLLKTGGTSFLLGLLFGDITGSGTVVWLGQMLIDSAHSRQAEAEADAFAADLMTRLGRSPKPLAAFLLRITGEEGRDPLPFLGSHPVTAERVRMLRAHDAPAGGAPLLGDAEWRALQAICD